MKQPLKWIGVTAVLTFASPLLRAAGPTGTAQPASARERAGSESSWWVMMAGCPEACPQSKWRARRVPKQSGMVADSVALDGNAGIMQLNLEEDGLESTRRPLPSHDPGPGQDLVMALNRLHDGLGNTGNPSRRAARFVVAGWQRSGVIDADRQVSRPTEVSETGLIVSWAWQRYDDAIDQLEQLGRSTAHAVGMALVRSWAATQAMTHAAYGEAEIADPEAQPPLDPVTTAWIESVRPAAENEIEAARLAAVGSSTPPEPASAPSQTASPSDRWTPTSEQVSSAPIAPPDLLGGETPPFEPTAGAVGEIGCGAIGLPRPVDAPGRARRIRY